MLLLGLFAVLAVVLAAVGVRRRRLCGIATHARDRDPGRSARAREVVQLMVWQDSVRRSRRRDGLAAAVAASRAMTDLREVRPHDPATFVAVTALLLGVVIVACVLPARRAIQVPPATRCDRNSVSKGSTQSRKERTEDLFGVISPKNQPLRSSRLCVDLFHHGRA
jgi:putative ABC transport system permease protein